MPASVAVARSAVHRSALGGSAPSAGHSAVPSAASPSVLAALLVDERDRDTPGLAIPRPETHLVVRFGPSARAGLDVHALGVRHGVYRKLIRRGQRTLTARLPLGAAQTVLGVPAAAIAGRVIELGELWGGAATRRLVERLAHAREVTEAAAILKSEIAERLPQAQRWHASARLARAAAARLPASPVAAVAADLGVSERHLRRAFHQTIGISPKAFAQLQRFHRALQAARGASHAGWASIAVAAGYYDQAHLIAEFRAITGLTPRALLGELRAAPLVL